MQQLHWPPYLHTIKVLSFVPLKLISQSDLLSYTMVLMWFPRGHKTGLKSAQTGSWQLLLCPAGLHFITTATMSHAGLHSQRTTQRLLERPVIRCYETLWCLCGFRVTQSMPHPLVRVQCKDNSAQKCEKLQAFPLQINISTYCIASVTEHTKEKKKIEKGFGYICFSSFWDWSPPFYLK